jgi:putative restriction endonuclease
LSGLPEPLLLDAAHIVADKDEQLGPASGAQRHPAFENPSRRIRHLPDWHRPGLQAACVERLLIQKDGPMLEALKRLNGEMIHLPTRAKDRPDRDRLALRFERFKPAA